MNRSPSAAIATLVRWREFGESLASNAYRQRSVEAGKAQQDLDGAKATVDEVQRHLSTLLDAPHLDLARLQVAAQIEDIAWLEMSARTAELEAARAGQSTAQAAHVAARARTRVATARHDRIAATERDRLEKTMFDRMADLRASARRKSR